MKNQVQLITYPDSLGGNLKNLSLLLEKYLLDIAKGGIHILPPFPSSGDRGFAPLTYFEIDPRFGSWEDFRRIGAKFDVIIDLMINHISRQSSQFQDFVAKGRKSEYADLFITLDKVWPNGDPLPEDVEKIFLRKPDNPFSTITIEETGQVERIWTSFGTKDWSEQIDLDVHSEKTRKLLAQYLAHFKENKVKMVRLDAIGYVIKKPGTSCFMVEPEIYEFLEWVAGVANEFDLEVLPEVHDHYTVQQKLSEHGYWVYDFILPMLILYTLQNRSALKLREYLKIAPRRQFTMLDCHDGIPVQPDVDDILDVEESMQIVEICLERGANLNRILSEHHKNHGNFDAHQINTTYYSALNCDDDAYLAARAIQFFSPGIPLVYYVGLLAGINDQRAVQDTGEGRSINRHNYSVEEVDEAIQNPVVQRLFALIRFRNEYPAFNGEFAILDTPEDSIILRWVYDRFSCRLTVDLRDYQATIDYIDDNGDALIYHI